MGQTLIQSSRAPQTVDITITRDSDTYDLSTATGASMLVTYNGATVTWSASIVTQSASSITIRHTLASDGSDVTTAGRYSIVPVLTFASGTVRCNITYITVRSV